MGTFLLDYESTSCLIVALPEYEHCSPLYAEGTGLSTTIKSSPMERTSLSIFHDAGEVLTTVCRFDGPRLSTDTCCVTNKVNAPA
jgi:hypothetical protein